jgi:hypothetical protein
MAAVIAARVLAAAAAAIGLMLVAYLDASGWWRLPILDRANYGWLLHFPMLIAAPMTTVLFGHWAGRWPAFATAAIVGLSVAAWLGIDSLRTTGAGAACMLRPETIVLIGAGTALYVAPALVGIVIAGSPPDLRARPIALGATLAAGVASILIFLVVGANLGSPCPPPRL